MAFITTNEAGDAIPAFWLNEVLEEYRANTLVSRLVRRDFENETGGVGDTINILKRGAITVQDKVEYDAGPPAVENPVVPESPSNSKVAVELNKHKYVSWRVEDNAGAKALSAGLNYIRDAIPALVEEIESEILAEYVNAAAAVGVVGTDIDSATIRGARLALNQAKVPTTNRFLLVSPEDDSALLGDPAFIAADKRGDGGRAMEEARLGRVFGFDTFMSQLIPTTTGPDARHNLAMHPDGIVLAVRPLPLPPPGSGARAGLLVDEEMGLAFRYTQGYSQTDMAMMHTIDILYGIKTVRPECLVEAIA
jgi:hypothetical protein